jgi:hypothetical protein
MDPWVLIVAGALVLYVLWVAWRTKGRAGYITDIRQHRSDRLREVEKQRRYSD